MNFLPQNFHIFIISLPLSVTLLSKSYYLTALNKTGCIGKFFEKINKDVPKTIVTANIELFVALVSSFQQLTNFTKNLNIGAMGFLNPPLASRIL